MKKLKLITDGSENKGKEKESNLDFGMLVTIIILLCAGFIHHKCNNICNYFSFTGGIKLYGIQKHIKTKRRITDIRSGSGKDSKTFSNGS